MNSSVWNFEQGYARNEEAQWYQSDNAVCKNGLLIIEARKEQNRKNPLYVSGSNDWRKKREFIDYTLDLTLENLEKAFDRALHDNTMRKAMFIFK